MAVSICSLQVLCVHNTCAGQFEALLFAVDTACCARWWTRLLRGSSSELGQRPEPMLKMGILEHGLLLWLTNSRFHLTLVMFWSGEPKS